MEMKKTKCANEKKTETENVRFFVHSIQENKCNGFKRTINNWHLLLI